MFIRLRESRGKSLSLTIYRMQYVETYREGVGVIEAMHERVFETPKTYHYHAKYRKNCEKNQLRHLHER